MYEFFLNEVYCYGEIICNDNDFVYKKFLEFEKYLQDNNIINDKLFYVEFNDDGEYIQQKFFIDSEQQMFYIQLKFSEFIEGVKKC